MNMRFFSLLSLAFVVCLSSAVVAQDAGRGRGRGGPGFGGRGGLGDIGGALELMGLLRMEEVRKEVDMSAETYEAISESMPNMRELLGSEGDRAASLKAANTKAQETLDEVLSPEHQRRLMGLLVQRNGSRAATNDLIAKEIGLDEAGVKKVQEAMTQASEGMREKMRELFTPDGDREKIREAMQEMTKEVDQAVAAVLTPAQKKALEDLKGTKFEFPENQGFAGRRGPGAGGRGPGAGAGGRGRRGGGTDN
ncbi:MAG: hypothetical protein KDA45_06885 [Planctomycetales bacterium]|nr:hypothetical protein [Planctomycetales bacterium]